TTIWPSPSASVRSVRMRPPSNHILLTEGLSAVDPRDLSVLSRYTPACAASDSAEPASRAVTVIPVMRMTRVLQGSSDTGRPMYPCGWAGQTRQEFPILLRHGT